MQLQKRLSEMFPGMLHLLQTKDSEAARPATSKDKDDGDEKKQNEKEEKDKAEQQSSAVQDVPDGDVTDDLFKDQDSSGKKQPLQHLE